ncbi:amino acid ABC transporter permease [Xylanimonas allomyrinae]|uniref:Amino acid ABC transporter permease n=1 Tax=Xylanimonas allomyrinae TaxID=2509459 RepID=A0A4P6EJ39_9MICO|nr:amino acid ABC transporter permease [Xylanimonas allomyrinae]QAY62620.1 amino acid ABC transporter permease [Xylanimonas allomyrinae]
MTFYFGDLLDYAPVLAAALWTSASITLVAMAAGSTLGVALYLGKAARVPVVSHLCRAYIEVFRNTPLLVQLYLIYFGLPEAGINLNPLWAGIVALTLNNAAYTAEIYRAGFESVPEGLREAGHALGMTRTHVFRHILLVPATRNVFPALTNQFILLFLASSIASIIGLPELMNQILNINNRTYLTFEVLAVGGLLYFLTSGLLVLASRASEAYFFRWGARKHA